MVINTYVKNICDYAKEGYLDGVKQCLIEDTDIEKTDHEGNTPLLIAAHTGHLDIVQYLVGIGAKYDKTKYDFEKYETNVSRYIEGTSVVVTIEDFQANNYYLLRHMKKHNKLTDDDVQMLIALDINCASILMEYH